MAVDEESSMLWGLDFDGTLWFLTTEGEENGSASAHVGRA